jgi:hypothetical protein
VAERSTNRPHGNSPARQGLYLVRPSARMQPWADLGSITSRMSTRASPRGTPAAARRCTASRRRAWPAIGKPCACSRKCRRASTSPICCSPPSGTCAGCPRGGPSSAPGRPRRLRTDRRRTRRRMGRERGAGPPDGSRTPEVPVAVGVRSLPAHARQTARRVDRFPRHEHRVDRPMRPEGSQKTPLGRRGQLGSGSGPIAPVCSQTICQSPLRRS